MRHARNILLALTSSVLLLASTLAAEDPSSTYELGVEALEDYRYSVAQMHFIAAAKKGNRDAQRNLGLMYLYGDALYGKDIPKNRSEAKYWLQLAANNGCEVSRLMLRVLASSKG